MTTLQTLKVIYCIGFIATFYGLKIDVYLRDIVWVRLLISIQWFAFIPFAAFMYLIDEFSKNIKIDFSKLQKWL